MSEADVIIIGAGAAGLMAARELSAAGRKVTIVEARDYTGGRIHTINHPDFSRIIDTGAEFIHGNLPLIKKIVKVAGIELLEMEGQAYQVKEGEIIKSAGFIEGYSQLISKLESLQKDIPFAEFLKTYFEGDRYKDLRDSVRRFVEGYDAADITKVSSFALRDEWKNEDDAQYHIEGGYNKITDFLTSEIKSNGGVLHLSTIVKEINRQDGYAEVICGNGLHLKSGKVIITIPPAILNSKPGSKGYIHFSPGIIETQNAAKLIGYGSVIKIFIEFKNAFWNDKTVEKEVRQMPQLGFLFCDLSPFRAWWSQLPDKTPLLTGWLAGPAAEEFKNSDDGTLANKAIETLTYLFKTSNSLIRERIRGLHIVNWGTDPFSLGAYSYNTTESAKAREVLNSPIDNMIFFSGEALYEGPAMGTVEAALSSGLNTSQKILQSF